MRKLTLLVSAGLACASLSRPAAAEPEAALNPAPAYFAEIARLDADLDAKVEAVAAAVDAEEKAGRLKPESAARQRTQVENVRTARDALFSFSATAAPGSDADSNRALLKAWAEYARAFHARQAYRAGLDLPESIARYADTLGSSARTAQELAPAIDLLNRLEQTVPQIRVDQQIEQTRSMLGRGQRVLAALDSGDSALLAHAAADFRQSTSDRVPGAEAYRSWFQRIGEDFESQLQKFQEETAAAIVKQSGSREVLALADRVDAASAKVRALRGDAEDGVAFTAKRPGLARAWGNLLAAMESGDWASAEEEENGIQALRGDFDPETWAVAVQKFGQIRRQRQAVGEAGRAGLEKRVLDRLPKVSDGESAEALADELSAEGATCSHPKMKADYATFAADLRQIGTLWNGGPPRPEISHPRRTAAWIKALAALSDRAGRAALASRAHASELLAPPLQGMPLEPAVRQLARDLFAGKEWLRLYDLLSQPSILLGEEKAPVDREAADAVKAFVTAQNFERAGQFSEAVDSFCTVLAAVGDLVPADAAAERLQVLRKEHPQAFSHRPQTPRRIPAHRSPWETDAVGFRQP